MKTNIIEIVLEKGERYSLRQYIEISTGAIATKMIDQIVDNDKITPHTYIYIYIPNLLHTVFFLNQCTLLKMKLSM